MRYNDTIQLQDRNFLIQKILTGTIYLARLVSHELIHRKIIN